MNKTAIFIDGAYYRKRASHLWGKKTPDRRAAELYAYCMEHMKQVLKDEGSGYDRGHNADQDQKNRYRPGSPALVGQSLPNPIYHFASPPMNSNTLLMIYAKNG